MKNKIDDLRNHLFAQLERLGDEDLQPEALERELARGRGISEIAQTLIDCAKVEVSYVKAVGADRGSEFLEASQRPSLEAIDGPGERRAG